MPRRVDEFWLGSGPTVDEAVRAAHKARIDEGDIPSWEMEYPFEYELTIQVMVMTDGTVTYTAVLRKG